MEFLHFCKRSLWFATPLLVWMMAVVVVDPFDYFNVCHVFPEAAKVANAAKLNTLVFNMLKEKHDPCENLIIGDSRAESLPVEQINQLTGRRYFCLSANALKLNESLDLFAFANQIKPVKRVVFTLNFNEFNDFAYADRVSSVEAMIQNPFLYLFDRNVAQAGYYVVKAAGMKQRAVDSTPPMTEQAFWDYIVKVRAREHYEKFRYPEGLYRRFQDLVALAKQKNIQVTFIVVPHHADFQKRVREFGLVDDYLRFKHDLSRLDARVVDYDYLNSMTTNQSNFRDPLHYNEKFGELIAREVFVGPLVVGKMLNPAWADQCSKYLF